MHCYATHHIRLYEYQQQNGHVRVEVWQRNAILTQKSEKFHSSLKTLHYRGESWQCSQVQIIGSTWIADYISVGENLQVLPRFSEAPIASRCIHTIISNRKSIESIADQQSSTWSSTKLTSFFIQCLVPTPTDDLRPHLLLKLHSSSLASSSRVILLELCLDLRPLCLSPYIGEESRILFLLDWSSW